MKILFVTVKLYFDGHILASWTDNLKKTKLYNSHSAENQRILVSLMVGRQIIEVQNSHLEQCIVGTYTQVENRQKRNKLEE